MNGRDPIEARKSELRKQLATCYTGIQYVIDGKLIFKPLNHWKKDILTYKLPRHANVAIESLEVQDTKLVPYATDDVVLDPNQYEYLLDLLRSRIEHIKEQPGSKSRLNLLEEQMFVVDLLCTLDI